MTPELVILAFEGPDKGGKGRLINEVNRQSKFEYLCIDRFTASAWVYDRLSGRRKREERLIALESELAGLKHAVVVNIIVLSEPNILRERIRREDEYPEQRLADLDRALEFYEAYRLNITRIPTIVADTSKQSPEITAAEILKQVSIYVDRHRHTHQRPEKQN